MTAEAEAGSPPLRLLRWVTAVLTTARPRPGFVTGRMTAGLPPAPLAGLAVALRLVPRPAWRRVSR